MTLYLPKPRTNLETLDWILFGLLSALMIGAGLWATKKSGKDLNSYFLGGQNLPWWIAGISMVATTFAADTPLAVTELVHQNGISGNWLWWNLMAGGMLTVFFFANLWRRSGVLTEVELIQIRYGGTAAKILRPFKAAYLGLFMNVMIIGWVNLAMITILSGFFGISEFDATIYMGITMLAVTVYCSLAGLLGVVITDNIQFVIMMVGSIALAYFVLSSEDIGGIASLKAQLPDSALSFFPNAINDSGGAKSITKMMFFAYVGMLWWASWYPGAEPGGGGYIAQRMMSTKNEKHAVYSTLFFQIAHYCIRPWPWILVGLSALVIYSLPQHLPADLQAEWADLSAKEAFVERMKDPSKAPEELQERYEFVQGAVAQYVESHPELSDNLEYEMKSRYGYIYALRDYVPAGWLGVLLVGFFAAYMSTISTQLNWGASYLVNDLYLPIREKKKSNSKENVITVSRITVLILAIIGFTVSLFIESISGVWEFIFECGAGLGLLLILRWFWWRINGWSEIAATIAPFIGYAFSKFVLGLEFPDSFFVTVGFTVVSWVAVMFLTPPESDETLNGFYQRIKPTGSWGKFKTIEGPKFQLLRLAVCWISAVTMTYALLFSTGKALFMEWDWAGIYAGIAILSGIILNRQLKKTRILN